MLDFIKDHKAEVASAAALTAVLTASGDTSTVLRAGVQLGYSALVASGLVAAGSKALTFGYNKYLNSEAAAPVVAPVDVAAPAPAGRPRRACANYR